MQLHVIMAGYYNYAVYMCQCQELRAGDLTFNMTHSNVYPTKPCSHKIESLTILCTFWQCCIKNDAHSPRVDRVLLKNNV